MTEASTIEALGNLSSEEIAFIRQRINGVAKSGRESQARIGLVNIACEHVHRSQKGGYRYHWSRYVDLGDDHEFINDEVAEKTFRELLTRQNKSGEEFDLFDVAIVLHHIRDEDAKLAKQVEETLTPYQLYLIEWSRKSLRGEETAAPRCCNDNGTGNEPSKGTLMTPSYLDVFLQTLKSRNLETTYWNYVYGKADKAGFVIYRHGLNNKNHVIQTYLNVSKNPDEPLGTHTFAHVYVPRRIAAQPIRLVRGYVIPTHSALYLIGFQDTSSSTGAATDKIDLRQPIEVMAIPVAGGLSSYKKRFRGLTLSTNEDGQLLATRIMLRRTSLERHDDSQSGFYEVKDLKSRLSRLHGAETGEAPTAVRKMADLDLEVMDILSGINNLVGLHVPDLISAGTGNTAVSGADLLEEMYRLFKAPAEHSAFLDADGRAFERKYHWRLGAIGDADPDW